MKNLLTTLTCLLLAGSPAFAGEKKVVKKNNTALACLVETQTSGEKSDNQGEKEKGKETEIMTRFIIELEKNEKGLLVGADKINLKFPPRTARVDAVFGKVDGLEVIEIEYEDSRGKTASADNVHIKDKKPVTSNSVSMNIGFGAMLRCHLKTNISTSKPGDSKKPESSKPSDDVCQKKETCGEKK